MNKLKKIGLTALAGSLVATSVFAGEMTVLVLRILYCRINFRGNGWS